MDVTSAPALQTLATVIVACNNAHLVDDKGWKAIGDPTEGALLAAGLKAGANRAHIERDLPKHHELPFDSDRKRMTIVVRDAQGARCAHVKGSPDILLPLCTHVLRAEGRVPLDAEERARLIARNEAHASQALRVLALAEREDPDADDPESGLTFLGFAAMSDPPRSTNWSSW